MHSLGFESQCLLHVYLYYLHQTPVERKREGDELSVYPKRRKTMDLYMKEREGKPNADCQSQSPMPTAKAGAQCRVPVPSPPRRHGGRRGRWGQARLVGASKAGGGRRGWWGQARPMGAVSHRAKSLVNTPPLAQGFPNEIKQNQRNKQKSEILLRVPNPIKSKSKENPGIQYKTKEIQKSCP